MAAVRENQILFALMNADEGPILTLGIPKAAWNYMRNGKTHTFDLRNIGFPVRLMLFGAETHDAALKEIERAAAEKGVPLLDERRKDFSIK